MLVSRGMDSRSTLVHAERDLARALSVRVEDIRCWMRTPASVGGAGSFPDAFLFNKRWLSLEREDETEDVAGFKSRRRRVGWDDVAEEQKAQLHKLQKVLPTANKVPAEVVF